MKPKIPLPFIQNRFFVPSRIALVVAALGAMSLFPAAPARAQEDVSVSAEANAGGDSYRLFYDKLGDDGDWYETQQYGYVYQPKVVTSNRSWRPYTDGYWAQTDAGWTWVSNENFGWATYHYGHWANLVDTGWVWVPGGEWSPGNVSWRVSKDHKHIGWAPLPLEARVERGQNLEAWVDTAYDIGPESYVFIDTDNFNDDSYVSHIAPVERNVDIITDTENVTRVSYRNVSSREVIYDGGPDVEIFRGGGRPVRRFDLELQPQNAEFFSRQDRRGINNVNGNRLVVATAARDVITSNTFRASQPARVTRTLNTVTVDRGYRGIGDQSAIERVRTTLRSQSPPPPPQVEQRATAALRRNGTVIQPGPRGAVNAPANAPVPPAPERDAAARAAGNVPPGAQDHPGHRPGANVPPAPGVNPAEAPAGRPGAVGEAANRGEFPPGKHNPREHGSVPPNPQGAPNAAEREVTGPANPAPRPPHAGRPERPEGAAPGVKPEEGPNAEHTRKQDLNKEQEPPRPKAEDRTGKPATERPDAPAHRPPEGPAREEALKPEEHGRPKAEEAVPHHQAAPEPGKAPEIAPHHPAAPESGKAPEAAPRHQAAPEPGKSEERQRPNQAESPAHREPAAEKAPAAPKAAAPERPHPTEGRAEEHKPAAEKAEHAPKEKPQDDEKKSPQKP